MALRYLFKANPLVAKAVGADSTDRYMWPDGTVLLWEPDLKKIDFNRFYTDREGLLADLGAVQLTDPETKAEQDHPVIRLPEARLPQYRWIQPGAEGESDTGTDSDEKEWLPVEEEHTENERSEDTDGNVRNEDGEASDV